MVQVKHAVLSLFLTEHIQISLFILKSDSEPCRVLTFILKSDSEPRRVLARCRLFWLGPVPRDDPVSENMHSCSSPEHSRSESGLHVPR